MILKWNKYLKLTKNENQIDKNKKKSVLIIKKNL